MGASGGLFHLAMDSPPGEHPEAPAPKKPRSNAGKAHKVKVRQGVWTAWLTHCELRPGLKLKTPEGDEVLGLIVKCFV